MASRRTIGNRIAPPRFILFFALMLVGSAIAGGWLERTLAIMAGFDVAALGFIIACAGLFDDASVAHVACEQLDIAPLRAFLVAQSSDG